jgi:long-chain acyl-CoA synthetase
MMTLPELLRQSARRHGDAPALRSAGAPCAEGVSYARLAALAGRGAARLRAAGLAPGDRVLLFCEPGSAWPVAFFSILAGGLVAVPLPAETPLPTAARVAAFAEARAALVGGRTRGLAVLLGGTLCVDAAELLRPEGPAPDLPEPRPGLAVLAFTSGSTSQPRAVELTHANLLANLDAMLQVRQAGPGDAFLSMLPPAHLFELMVGQLGPLACGARVVYSRSLMPHRLIAALRDEGISHALSVPALVDALYQEVLDELAEAGVIHPAVRGQAPEDTAAFLRQATEADLAPLRAGFRGRIGGTFHTLFVGGAALDPAWAVIAPAFGIGLEVGYGLTEAGPVVSSGQAGACPPGSVGRPLPGVAVRLGEGGEILVCGPNVMRGYFKDPDATAAALPDGWLRTGDRGRLDADGFLFITGRLKEAMVTAAGETIYPEEVEPYYASPRFAEWCVAALPGPQGNDLPTLFVVPAAPTLTEGDLRQVFDDLRAAAPARFRLSGVERVAGPLPRTATGKVRRLSVVQLWAKRACPSPQPLSPAGRGAPGTDSHE